MKLTKRTKSFVLCSLILSGLGAMGAGFQLPAVQAFMIDMISQKLAITASNIQLFAQATTENELVVAKLGNCTRRGNSVQCSPVVISKIDINSLVRCGSDTRIFDLLGNVHYCSKATVGDRTAKGWIRFPKNVPVKINFTFQDVPPSINELSAVEIFLDPSDSPIFYLLFNNIKISQ